MSECTVCGQTGGGLHTNGDGFSDGKHVDFDPGPFQFWCWDHADQAPNHNKEITQRFHEKGMCGFLEAWVGRCQNSVPCEKHISQKCWCGAQATWNCDIASSLVCGQPLCSEHKCHRVAGGMTGSKGAKHNEKGYKQFQEWKSSQ